MKTLQKQRQEEADARRAVEASFGTLRKEKQTQDQQTQTQTASTDEVGHALSRPAHGCDDIA